MKKATAILLSLLFFLTSTNYIFLFIERLETIKSHMQEKVSSNYTCSEITIFKFSLNDINSKLRWLDKNEFMLDGKMYDVIRIDEHNNELTIYCLNDEKEEKLISNYNNLNDGKGKQESFVIVHHNSIVLYAIRNDCFLFKKFNTVNSQPCFSPDNYHSVLLDIITPPPRRIV